MVTAIKILLPLTINHNLAYLFTLEAVAAVLGRLVFISTVDYDYYATLAADNVNQEISTLAPRGIIFDRFGKELVENEAIFNINGGRVAFG